MVIAKRTSAGIHGHRRSTIQRCVSSGRRCFLEAVCEGKDLNVNQEGGDVRRKI